MASFEEKDIKELRKKKKSFKQIIKKTVIGVCTAATIFSMIPNIRYGVALVNAKNNSYIVQTFNDNISRKEQVALIFAEGIRNNPNISEEFKEIIIYSFTENVINKFGDFFPEQLVYNMYAVASTESWTIMSDFAQKHGWWSGNYNPYLNNISIEYSNDQDLIAHEQLHAILKYGLFGVGFTGFNLKGYAINEGANSLLSSDETYLYEQSVVNALGLIIGYDTVFNYFLNSDLSGLKEELCRYLPANEVDKFIFNLDCYIFADYLEIFCKKNEIDFDISNKNIYEHFKDYSNNQISEIQEFLIKLFEAKYNISIDESLFGKILINYLNNFDSKYKIDIPISGLSYYDDGQVLISIGDGLFARSYIFSLDDLMFYNNKNIAIEDIKTLFFFRATLDDEKKTFLWNEELMNKLSVYYSKNELEEILLKFNIQYTHDLYHMGSKQYEIKDDTSDYEEASQKFISLLQFGNSNYIKKTVAEIIQQEYFFNYSYNTSSIYKYTKILMEIIGTDAVLEDAFSRESTSIKDAITPYLSEEEVTEFIGYFYDSFSNIWKHSQEIEKLLETLYKNKFGIEMRDNAFIQAILADYDYNRVYFSDSLKENNPSYFVNSLSLQEAYERGLANFYRRISFSDSNEFTNFEHPQIVKKDAYVFSKEMSIVKDSVEFDGTNFIGQVTLTKDFVTAFEMDVKEAIELGYVKPHYAITYEVTPEEFLANRKDYDYNFEYNWHTEDGWEFNTNKMLIVPTAQNNENQRVYIDQAKSNSLS